MTGATLPWEKMLVSGETATKLRGYVAWSRLMEGEHIFIKVALTDGSHALTFPVPADATLDRLPPWLTLVSSKT